MMPRRPERQAESHVSVEQRGDRLQVDAGQPE